MEGGGADAAARSRRRACSARPRSATRDETPKRQTSVEIARGIRSERRVYRYPRAASTVSLADRDPAHLASEPALRRVRPAGDGDVVTAFRAIDALAVVAAAITLALFEGPVSLRKLRADLAGFPSDVSVAKLVLGRLVWIAWLAPLFLVLWRLGARELTRRRRLPERVALAAEALPFVPFLWLALGFAPGWGNTVPEAWSSAMLLLFLGVVATSSALRLALWHSTCLASRSVRQRSLALAIFLAMGVALGLGTRIAAPIDAQPHWSTLADRSPYWPTRGYVVLWTAWVTWLAVPALVLPGLLLARRRPRAAQLTALALAGAAIALGLVAASAARATWDRRFVAAHCVPGASASTLVAGRPFEGRVVPVPGKVVWRFAPGILQGLGVRTVDLRVRTAPLPQAGYWYRAAEEVEIEVRVATDGREIALDRWRIDPRARATDRPPRELVRTLTLLPGRALDVWVRAAATHPSATPLPILATAELTPAQ